MSEDFFGNCHKCGDKVIGEGNGCSAMGEVYHVTCFTCAVCAQPLRGKQFYAINVSNYKLIALKSSKFSLRQTTNHRTTNHGNHHMVGETLL